MRTLIRSTSIEAALATMLLLLGLTPSVRAQAVETTNPAERVIYPADSQTPEAQSADEQLCYDWSVESTTWNPAVAFAEIEETHSEALADYQATRGGAVRGAARGALAGLAIGAIAGDAGQGAAIGAVAGGAGGGIRARRGRQAAQAAFDEAVGEFTTSFRLWDRHWNACMEGNGYVVR
jgi:hypothetical protein